MKESKQQARIAQWAAAREADATFAFATTAGVVDAIPARVLAIEIKGPRIMWSLADLLQRLKCGPYLRIAGQHVEQQRGTGAAV